MARREMTLPELGIDTMPITLSVWLRPKGARVAEGEPIVEVLCDGATVDLPAPADGVLLRKLVGEEEPVEVGQSLAVIEVDEF